jgi:pimeloyl-ACP methyl ester carboxylesterase
MRCSQRCSPRLHAAIPDSTLVVLPGIGHICNIEAPDAFNQVVRDFIRARQR